MDDAAALRRAVDWQPRRQRDPALEQLFEEIAERRSLEPPRWWRRSGRSEEIARWIEHYPAGLYSGGEEYIGRVVFDYRVRRSDLRVFCPEWTPLSRAELERMTGQPFE
jgi:hypothetical protein